MRRVLLLLVVIPALAWAQRPPTAPPQSLGVDANGNVTPFEINGQPLNLPAGTLVDGIEIISGIEVPNEVWISSEDTRDTATGTLSDPYDGSTAAKFDALMAAIPASTKIHLTTGTFLTNGGITVKEGWSVHGVGRDMTVVKLANGRANTAGDDRVVFSWLDNQGTPLTYFELGDMTIDLNGANQTIFTGSLNGYLAAFTVSAYSGKVSNVKILSMYSKPGEGFPARIYRSTAAGTGRAEISGVQVVSPRGTSQTAISVFDQGAGIGNFTANAATDVLTLNSHGMIDGSRIAVANSGGALPAGLTAGTIYFARDVTTNTFKIAASVGGAAIDITTAGTGTHTIARYDGTFSGFIRDCTVTDGPATVGFGAGGWKSFQVINNETKDCIAGMVIDTHAYDDVLIQGNKFIGCTAYGILANGSGPYNRMRILGNAIDLATTGPEGGQVVYLSSGDFVVANNTLKTLRSGAPALVAGATLTGTVTGNTIIATANSDLQLVTGLRTMENVDAAGAQISFTGHPTDVAVFADDPTSNADFVPATWRTGLGVKTGSEAETFTNKSMDGDDNPFTDLPFTSFKNYATSTLALTDPNAHRALGWDDTDGSFQWITYGSGLSYDHGTHTLSASGGVPTDSPTFTTQVGISSAANPKLLFNATGNSADARKFQTYVATDGKLILRAINDAETVEGAGIKVDRAGGLIAEGALYSGSAVAQLTNATTGNVLSARLDMTAIADDSGLTDFTIDPSTAVSFNAGNWRADLGLVIGTNVQAFDADLTTWAGITPGTGVAASLATANNTAGGYSPIDGTATLSNKTLTAPRFADGGFIADANGNELIVLDTVTSAVNEVTLANAATGGSPTFTASGGDTNISIALTPKGTGKILAGLGGSASNPIYAFATDTNADTGIYRVTENQVGIAGGGSAMAIFEATSGGILNLGSWSAGGTNTIRGATGGAGNSNRAGTTLTLQSGQSTGNGAPGDIIFGATPAGSSGTSVNAYAEIFRIKTGATKHTGAAYASLPTPEAGMQAYVTDGAAGNCGDGTCTTWGTTVTGGGGSLKLLVWYNGTNWTLIGK